ncbi:MAG: hypothetical protein WAL11_11095, partial [Pseudolabrys sp.]
MLAALTPKGKDGASMSARRVPPGRGDVRAAHGNGRLYGFSLACRSRSAIEPGLRGGSPENGNNGEDMRRFSVK